MSIELDFGDGTELDTWVSVLDWYGDITFYTPDGPRPTKTVWGKIGYTEGEDGLVVKEVEYDHGYTVIATYPIHPDDIIKVVIS